MKAVLKFWIPSFIGIGIVVLVISLLSLSRNGELDLLLIFITCLGGLIGGLVAFFSSRKQSDK